MSADQEAPAGSADQEVLGDQQQAVGLAELVEVAVEAVDARELQEKQTHRMPVQVGVVVQDRLGVLVVVLELILATLAWELVVRELQTSAVGLAMVEMRQGRKVMVVI